MDFGITHKWDFNHVSMPWFVQVRFVDPLCCPLLFRPPIPPSIRVFSNESTLRMRWPKYWSYSFSIIPSKEHPGLISFRMDWLHLLAVQGTLKSLLQQHSSKASILWRPKNQDTVVVVVKEAQRSTRQNREPKYKSIQGQITDF